MLRAQPFQPRPQPECTHEAVRARKTRPCGGAPLMCAAAARARPDRFGLSDQAGADRRTPLGGWGEPEPGRRSLQQRGEPARSGMPRPDGLNMTHTISGRAVFLGEPRGYLGMGRATRPPLGEARILGFLGLLAR